MVARWPTWARRPAPRAHAAAPQGIRSNPLKIGDKIEGGGFTWGLLFTHEQCTREQYRGTIPPPPSFPLPLGLYKEEEGSPLLIHSFIPSHLSLSLPHVWFRNIGTCIRGLSSPPYARRRAAGSSVQIFLLPLLRWTGARGTSSTPDVCRTAEVLPVVALAIACTSARP